MEFEREAEFEKSIFYNFFYFFFLDLLKSKNLDYITDIRIEHNCIFCLSIEKAKNLDLSRPMSYGLENKNSY